MTTATHTRATTEAYEAFARSVETKGVDRNEIVSKFSDLATSETFSALRLTFDTLVNAVQTEGVTPRSTALISALDAISIRFMSESHAVSGTERQIGRGIENGAFEGLRGQVTEHGFVPYTAEELVCVLVANLHGHGGASLQATKEFAASATGNFTLIRSDGSRTFRPAK